MLGSGVVDSDAAAGDGSGDEIGAAFDSIRQHGVTHPMQRIHALNSDRVGSRPLYQSTHFYQGVGKIDHLRLPRRVLDHGLSPRKDRRHHQVLGARHGHAVEDEPCPPQPVGARTNVTVINADLCSHGAESGDVEIHRPRADCTPSRQRDVCAAITAQQRTEYQHRRPHGLNELVGRLETGHAGWIDLEAQPVVKRDLNADAPEQLDRRGDVVQMGDVLQDHRAFREK